MSRSAAVAISAVAVSSEPPKVAAVFNLDDLNEARIQKAIQIFYTDCDRLHAIRKGTAKSLRTAWTLGSFTPDRPGGRVEWSVLSPQVKKRRGVPENAATCVEGAGPAFFRWKPLRPAQSRCTGELALLGRCNAAVRRRIPITPARPRRLRARPGLDDSAWSLSGVRSLHQGPLVQRRLMKPQRTQPPLCPPHTQQVGSQAGCICCLRIVARSGGLGAAGLIG